MEFIKKPDFVILLLIVFSIVAAKPTPQIKSVGENEYPPFESFDTNKDGKIKMYRKMSKEEYDRVMPSKKLQPTIELPETGEVWLSTSFRHTVQYHNDIRSRNVKDFVVTFYVDAKALDRNLKGFLTPQKNSAKENDKLDPWKKKNVLNKELLRGNGLGMFNIGFKGEANVGRFNKAVKKVESASEDDFLLERLQDVLSADKGNKNTVEGVIISALDECDDKIVPTGNQKALFQELDDCLFMKNSKKNALKFLAEKLIEILDNSKIKNENEL